MDTAAPSDTARPTVDLSGIRRRGNEPSANAIRRLLVAARTHFAMDVAFVSEFVDGARVFRFVDAAGDDPAVHVGGSDPLEDSYCQRVVDRRLPEVIPDASQNPEAARLAVTAALPVGAHLSVPITLADGHVFGTFCCFKSGADASLTERDGAVMHLFASLAAGYLDSDRTAEPELELAPAAERPRRLRYDDGGDVAGELRRLQRVGVPAVGALILCTAVFGL